MEQGHALPKWLDKFLAVCAGVIAVFYMYSAARGQFHPAIQRSIITAFALAAIFLQRPISVRIPRVSRLISDGLLALLSISTIAYLCLVQLRAGSVFQEPTRPQLLAGAVLLCLVIEAGRRAVGVPMSLLAVSSIAYACFGSIAPGMLRHPGYSWQRIVDFMTVGTFGVFGLPIDVASTIIIAFILFAAFLRSTRASDLFFKLPYALMGNFRGGPAKLAVVSSALFGTLSGSPTSNVVSTGTLTIPLMQRTGYASHEAGAVEAVASTGGVLMPPVMGAVAFLMADILGIPYATVVKAAILPALLYFLGLFLMVDQLALANRLRGVPRSELPSVSGTVKSGWYYALPVVVLVYWLLFVQGSAMQAAFWATVLAALIGVIDPHTRLGLVGIWNALVEGTRDVVVITVVCAVAGIIVGTVSMTGVGINISSFLIQVSSGQLFILLLITAVACLILGMGLPTSASYLFLAILIAPALIQMEVNPLAAHLFLVYFATVACFTPPVAVACFAAAPIAGASPFKIGWASMRLGFVAFVVPFFFAYDASLLLQEVSIHTLGVVATSIIGVFLMSLGLGGQIGGPVNSLSRGVFILGSLALIKPGIWTDIFGLAAALIGFLYHRSRLNVNSRWVSSGIE